MKRNSILVFFLLFLGLIVSNYAPAAAQGAQPTPDPALPTPSDNQVNAVAHQLFCPVCENIPLDVCPTTACQNWRELIRQKLAEGQTPQEIKDYFAQQYGDRVLAEPPRKGLNWLVYVAPPLFLLGGLLILWNVLRPARRKVVVSGISSGVSNLKTEHSSPEDVYMAKFEEELRKQKD